jgi:uncharacterized protein
MDRAHALELLSTHKPVLMERFGVTELGLFGSTARGVARADSDVDLLVAFDGPATPDRYFGALFYLEDVLRVPVDLVTDKALRPRLKPYVDRDLISI